MYSMEENVGLESHKRKLWNGSMRVKKKRQKID